MRLREVLVAPTCAVDLEGAQTGMWGAPGGEGPYSVTYRRRGDPGTQTARPDSHPDPGGWGEGVLLPEKSQDVFYSTQMYEYGI